MKKFLIFLFAILAIPCANARDAIEWNRPYIFTENGKRGLLINEEVCLLPTFDTLRRNGDFFIFSDDGKEGILNLAHLVLPAMYDEILRITETNGNLIVKYRDGEEMGLLQLGGTREYRTPTNEIVVDTVPTKDIIPCGNYADIKLMTDFEGYSTTPQIYALTIDKKGQIEIFDFRTGVNYTPYYDLKKLGGNISKVMSGKLAWEKLEVKRKGKAVEKDFRQIDKDHPELTKNLTPAKVVDKSWRRISTKNGYDSEAVLDSISIGNYKGVITDIGFVSIPLQYSDIEDVYARNPGNISVMTELLKREMRKYDHRLPDTWGADSETRFEMFRQYYKDEYKFYSHFIPLVSTKKL